MAKPGRPGVPPVEERHIIRLATQAFWCIERLAKRFHRSHHTIKKVLDGHLTPAIQEQIRRRSEERQRRATARWWQDLEHRRQASQRSAQTRRSDWQQRGSFWAWLRRFPMAQRCRIIDGMLLAHCPDPEKRYHLRHRMLEKAAALDEIDG
jgi:hypothetical protein